MPKGIYDRPGIAERLWGMVAFGPVIRPELGPCWVWTGSTTVDGYGLVRYRGLMVRASRLAWWLMYGRMPEPFALHRCDNPPCVRPTHLFEGTAGDNIRDAVTKGRHHQVAKTHCPKGHPYDEANTYHRPDGGRDCIACHNARRRMI